MVFNNVLKEVSFRVFLALDRVGIHLLPKHYYTPVADYKWLQKNRNAWMGRTDLAGVHWDLDEQLCWLRKMCEPYYHEVAGLQSFREIQSSGWGPGFGPIESQVLHCFVRYCAPTRVIEIGSGASTASILRASYMNKREGRRESKIVSIEPLPTPKLRDSKEVTLIEEMAQKTSKSIFDEIRAGDLLFIDSTHTVKLGSELQRIYLEIIPNLPPGVFIHIHDIYLPYLYSRNALSNYFDWQETSLVLALLKYNSHLSVLCCQSALHYDRTKELSAVIVDYRPQANFEGLVDDNAPENHFPSSLYMRTS